MAFYELRTSPASTDDSETDDPTPRLYFKYSEDEVGVIQYRLTIRRVVRDGSGNITSSTTLVDNAIVTSPYTVAQAFTVSGEHLFDLTADLDEVVSGFTAVTESESYYFITPVTNLAPNPYFQVDLDPKNDALATREYPGGWSLFFDPDDADDPLDPENEEPRERIAQCFQQNPGVSAVLKSDLIDAEPGGTYHLKGNVKIFTTPAASGMFGRIEEYDVDLVSLGESGYYAFNTEIATRDAWVAFTIPLSVSERTQAVSLQFGIRGMGKLQLRKIALNRT